MINRFKNYRRKLNCDKVVAKRITFKNVEPAKNSKRYFYSTINCSCVDLLIILIFSVDSEASERNASIVTSADDNSDCEPVSCLA